MATLREVKKRFCTVKSTWEFSITIVALVLIVTSSGYGFDGRRQGFVLGGGLGASPLAHWNYDFTSINDGQTGAGLGLNFLLGLGSNEQNMFALESNYSLWNSSELNGLVSQGFGGVVWYHYYSLQGPSTFTTLGAGLYFFDGEGFSRSDPGLAMLLGAGAELSKNWQIGGYFSLGGASSEGVDFKLHHLNFLVSYLAY